MERNAIARMLRALGSNTPRQAWAEFLEVYSPLILRVVRIFEEDLDHISDCYLFVCERLSRGRFRRLRKFRVGGPASFSTWLRAVVRNLCLDWHRQQFGRYRVFQSIARLPALDQEVFRLLYDRGLPSEEAVLQLRPAFPQATPAQIKESAERVLQSLTPRQRWLLSFRQPLAERAEEPNGGEKDPLSQIRDLSPDPECLATRAETRAALESAVARLSSNERLLIRLRYGHDLTLEQIAGLLGLKDAQTTDRRIREVLERLRGELSRRMGKGESLSV